jgi:hypothetical protein
MRALAKSRLFGGSISAGGGSCQVTFNGSGTLSDEILYASIPLGNRSAYKAHTDTATALWPKGMPVMTREYLRDWRAMVKSAIEQSPECRRARNLRGLFVGEVLFIMPEAAFSEGVQNRLIAIGHLQM